MDSDFGITTPEIDESGCLARDDMVILGHFKLKLRADVDRKEDPKDGWSVRTCLLAKKLCERIEEGQQRIDALRHRLNDQRKQLEALKTSSLCLKAKRTSGGIASDPGALPLEICCTARMVSGREGGRSSEQANLTKEYLTCLVAAYLGTFFGVTIGDDEAVICPTIGIADRLGYQHVLSISPPDENIAQQLPAPPPRVHPHGLLPRRKAEEGVQVVVEFVLRRIRARYWGSVGAYDGGK
ncbi:unnamed protein product [Schistocephalus solidus]|uniref:BHLH domain-containing protein n=1 Tax=Schistocephalus solidus TaxID=70667 RepID=A0A183T2M5_SCHSO|nr:unnamed protein product [Schistocephalus solidus]